jgi:hypothetical protein
MRTPGLRTAAALAAVALGGAGCNSGTSSAAEGAEKADAPVQVQEVAGSDVKQVTLTAQAARRLDIQTVAVAAATGRPGAAGGTAPNSPAATLVPYSAVVYAADGTTWLYTVPRPLTYVRTKVAVASVGGAQGTEATLSAGPPVGTTVVSTGVVELYGAELGVGK